MKNHGIVLVIFFIFGRLQTTYVLKSEYPNHRKQDLKERINTILYLEALKLAG